MPPAFRKSDGKEKKRMNDFEMRALHAPLEAFDDREALEALYVRAFPQNERSPLEEIINEKSGMLRVLAFYRNAVFCGMAVTLSTAELTHIIYLAIEEAFRGQGLGSRALEAIEREARGKKVIVDVERAEENASSNDQRTRRIAFYLKNGYRETAVGYRWREEDYVILSYGGVMTKREWGSFWKEVEERTGRDW